MSIHRKPQVRRPHGCRGETAASDRGLSMGDHVEVLRHDGRCRGYRAPRYEFGTPCTCAPRSMCSGSQTETPWRMNVIRDLVADTCDGLEGCSPPVRFLLPLDPGPRYSERGSTPCPAVPAPTRAEQTIFEPKKHNEPHLQRKDALDRAWQGFRWQADHDGSSLCRQVRTRTESIGLRGDHGTGPSNRGSGTGARGDTRPSETRRSFAE